MWIVEKIQEFFGFKTFENGAITDTQALGGEFAEDIVEDVTPEVEQEEQQAAQWQDPEEPFKFVCEGGKAKCIYHSSEAELKGTSTKVKIQDNIQITNGDKDGKINFDFQSFCSHPKWNGKQPPCKSVIKLDKWTDFSDTRIDKYQALLVKSTIACNISKEKLTITHSGQKAGIDPIYGNEYAKITSIGLLEENTVLTQSEVLQYVNLPRNANFVNNGITHIDRLGRKLRLRVQFEKAGKFRFTVTLKLSNKVSYSNNEETNNPNFGQYTEEKDFVKVTDANGIVLLDLDSDVLVTVAGDEKFEIKAKDKMNVEVKAKTKVKTMRRLYYAEAVMTGVTNALPNLSSVISEYKKSGIELVSLGRSLGMHAQDDVTANNNDPSNERTTFANNLNAICAGSVHNYNGYYFLVGYGRYSVKSTNDIKTEPKPAGARASVDINLDSDLYHNIDNTKDWYIDAFYQSNVAGSAPIPIPKALLSPQGSDPVRKVRVNTSSLPVDAGVLTLRFKKVTGFLGGFSISGTNIILITTMAKWVNNDQATQTKIVIHELGHAVKMVTSSGSNLDHTPSHYTGQGHQGNHCHDGVTAKATDYTDNSDLLAAKCVMFGSVCNASSFCNDCKKALRKLDLHNAIPS